MDLETIRARLKARHPGRAPGLSLPSAAVSLILAPSGGELELLLIKRSEHPKDPWSGHMALPGGRREARDRSLAATARRETLEETGIAIDRPSLLGELEDLLPLSPGAPRLVIRPFVFGLRKRPPVVPSPEVAGHLWTTLTALKASFARTTVLLGGRKLEVDAYLLGPHVVWGITQRILARFLGLL